MERIKIKMDEMSIIRYIPIEVIDKAFGRERLCKGVIVEMVTSVGGVNAQDVEIQWHNDEPLNVTDEEILEAYENTPDLVGEKLWLGGRSKNDI